MLNTPNRANAAKLLRCQAERSTYFDNDGYYIKMNYMLLLSNCYGEYLLERRVTQYNFVGDDDKSSTVKELLPD